MAGLLKDDFSTKRPITQVPAAWFNAVAKILNGITAGAGININKNGTDTAAWEFELDLEYAKKYLGIEDAEKPDDLTHEDITDWDTATADFLDGDDYDAIIEAIGDVADIVDGILADYLDSGDINVTVAAKNHTHTTANITDWATATADFLTDADMSNYALEADLLTLAEEVTWIEGDILDLADAVEQIDTDLAALEDDFDDLYAALYPSGTKDWVDLTTNQIIRGSKRFTKTVFLAAENTEYFEIENITNSTRGYFGHGEIWLDKNAGAIPIHFRDFGRVEKARIYYDYSDTLLHLVTYNNNGSGFKNNGVVLSANPTDVSDTSSKVVPTMGWVNDKFSRKTHHHDDVYAKINHTHSGYATTNHTHSGYASSNHNHAGVYANATHQHVAADITNLGTTIDGKITTFSNTVSTTYATKAALNGLTNTVNEIDADLLELADYVDSMDADIADLADWYATGRGGTFNVVTKVEWTGTVLRMSWKSVTFTNGLITAIGNDSTTTIDSPILFENS